MERRRDKRLKRRLTCSLLVRGRSHSGIVVDISTRGLFVRSNTALRPGEKVTVKVRDPAGDEFELTATVARRFTVPPRLASVAGPGVGLSVENAPEEYLRLVEGLFKAEVDTSAKPSDSQPGSDPPPGRAYRVRMKQISGSRSRTLSVTAESEEDARAAAIAQLGEEWELLDVDLA